MFIKYNRKLKEVSRNLRNKSTESEILFWKFLKTFFPEHKFYRQKPLDNFIVDFYCTKLKLIIEIDGSIHNTQKYKDKERDNLFFQKYRLTTLRFTNQEVLKSQGKIEHKIKSYIALNPPLFKGGRGIL